MVDNEVGLVYQVDQLLQAIDKEAKPELDTDVSHWYRILRAQIPWFNKSNGTTGVKYRICCRCNKMTLRKDTEYCPECRHTNVWSIGCGW